MFTRKLQGCGSAETRAAPRAVWDVLLDPACLARLIPGEPLVERRGPDGYRAVIRFGVGPLSGHYDAGLLLVEVDAPRALVLEGGSEGAFGSGQAKAWVSLEESAPGTTTVRWRYESSVHGPVALVGRTMLNTATHLFVQRFFARLACWQFAAA